jgi:hypothetical protein
MMGRICSRRFTAALLALLILTIGMIGIATASNRPMQIMLEQSGRLAPSHVSYNRTSKGLEIDGRIEKRPHHYGRILGHVEIELLDTDGKVVGRASGALQHFSPTRRNPDWASFSLVIDQVPTEASAIRVQHIVGSRH